MKNVFGTGLLVVLLTAMAPLAMADPAHDMVMHQHLGSNLKTLAFATAQKTHTFATLASKIGISAATSLVSRELDVQAQKFQIQWDDNLAQAYARHFTAEELASLAAQGRDSKYFRKLAEKQAAIGADMQRMSTPILMTYVTDVLTAALSRMSKY
jgi:hypothetical protein